MLYQRALLFRLLFGVLLFGLSARADHDQLALFRSELPEPGLDLSDLSGKWSATAATMGKASVAIELSKTPAPLAIGQICPEKGATLYAFPEDWVTQRIAMRQWAGLCLFSDPKSGRLVATYDTVWFSNAGKVLRKSRTELQIRRGPNSLSFVEQENGRWTELLNLVRVKEKTVLR